MSTATRIDPPVETRQEATEPRRRAWAGARPTPVWGGVSRAAALLAWMYLTAQLCLLAWVAIPALVLGWEPHVVTSASMAPKIRMGEVVLSAPPSERQLETGTIVVFEDEQRGGLVTHRVVGQEADGSYRTQGDANPTPDRRPVPSERIVGVGRLLVPMAGLPVVWLRSGAVLPCAIWAMVGVACIVIAPGRSLAQRLRRRKASS